MEDNILTFQTFTYLYNCFVMMCRLRLSLSIMCSVSKHYQAISTTKNTIAIPCVMQSLKKHRAIERLNY